MRKATSPCLDTFCRVDRLGLTVAGQRVGPDHSVLRCRPTTSPSPCPGCVGPGARHDVVVRRLAHVLFGWEPTILGWWFRVTGVCRVAGSGVTASRRRCSRGGSCRVTQSWWR